MREAHGRVSVVPQVDCPEAVVPEICDRAKENGFLDQKSMIRHLDRVHGIASEPEAQFKISSAPLGL